MHLRNANPKLYFSTYSFTHEFGFTHESKDLLENWVFHIHLNILKTCEIGSKTVLFNSVHLKLYWSCIRRFWLIILNYHFWENAIGQRNGNHENTKRNNYMMISNLLLYFLFCRLPIHTFKYVLPTNILVTHGSLLKL